MPQEISLFPHLSVAENLFMPFDQSGFEGTIVHPAELDRAARPQLECFRIRAHPRQQVREMSVSDQQLLMIARACAHRELDVLILDEPTSSLTIAEVERLFEIVRRLRDEGKGIVFISHKSEEIFEIGDEVTVLRDGRSIGHFPITELDEARLLSLMAGEEVLVEEHYQPATQPGEVLLEVRGLSGPRFRDVSFDLRRGEILGFAGLVGSGRSELMQSIFGYRSADGGEVRLLGRPLPLGEPARSVAAGLVYLSEERRLHGILPMQSVLHNTSIALFDETSHLDRQGAKPRPQDRRAVRRAHAFPFPAHQVSFRGQSTEGDHRSGDGHPPESADPRRAHPGHRRTHQDRDLPAHETAGRRGASA
ncbi:MAG TPA: sugar ABC transporter ATP-binding protein [Rhodospirillales bacterium]|nr:sugar ABC transporter ATP-binding protein [Rhodospirillales bacterium]